MNKQPFSSQLGQVVITAGYEGHPGGSMYEYAVISGGEERTYKNAFGLDLKRTGVCAGLANNKHLQCILCSASKQEILLSHQT